MKFSASVSGFGLGLLSFIEFAAARPSNTTIVGDYELMNHLTRRAEPGDFYLRVMPLGASITAGEYSPDDAKNGYRKFTRDKLRADGWDVNMVGNFNMGTMSDNVRLRPRVVFMD